MKIKNNFYTYPVLSSYNNDYVNSVFDVSYEIVDDGFGVNYIEITTILSDSKLEDFLDKGIVGLYVHVECPSTSYREMERFDNIDRVRIPINEMVMQNRLEINTFILLDRDVEEYSSYNFNPDLFNKYFTILNLEKGSILASSITKEITIENSADLFRNLSSIISVALSSKGDYMEVNYDSDVIMIYLPEKMYKEYIVLSNTGLGTLVLTSTVMPALIYVMDLMYTRGNEENQWYKVIKQKLEENEIDISQINDRYTSIELFQRIFQNPLSKALENGVKFLEEVDNG